MTTVLERFLSYVSIDTTSAPESTTYPSTPNQLVLGKQLVQELQEMGLSEVKQDEYGYITATIPATVPNVPVLGLIAHMDTSDAVSGANIKPHILRYEGGDIVLNEDKNILLAAKENPFLEKWVGKNLIATDGTTLLGADDKAGIAEIMAVAERLMAKDAAPHGKVRIAFTPDEEIGAGTKYFSIKDFGADIAYTVDGGDLGELEYENFNAATAKIDISGYSVHPGTAKNKMINATVLGGEFLGLLPEQEQPAHTEGRQGFYHVVQMTGSIEHCHIEIAIRDHDAAKFAAKKQLIEQIGTQINAKWQKNVVQVTIKDSYYNMRAVIDKHMDLVEHAREAFLAHGVTPLEQPIRGGTDGARLSLAGLPCPNLSTGGYNFHGRFECIPVEALHTMVDVLEELVVLWSK